MGIFSGLEILGFKDEKRNIYEEPKSQKKVEGTKKEKKEKIVREEDILFPKTYNCPICDNSFKSLAVRAGKLRSREHDDDLRPRYKGVDPLKYDAIVCPNCGYSAIARYFNRVMPVQGKRIRAEIMPKFQGIVLSQDKYSYEDAVLHYKMVLMCDVVGGVQTSRRAYTCLKMAWVIRGWLETEGSSMPEDKKKELEADHKECIQNAYEGYVKAFSSETFPMSGMDEMTLTYLVSQLAFEVGDYAASLRMLSKVLGNQGAPARIKDKALELKEKIRAEVTKSESN